ncbi:MAG: VacJ family lipoprotein [Alphaproteobacteria bacterium]|nr:VacJ family lipoprotein [Alphaproteobacteria bacterium]
MQRDKAEVFTMKKKRFTYFALVAGTALSLTACAMNGPETTGVSSGDVTISDPFEGFNRRSFAFNDAISDNVIHPVLKGYRAVVPKPAREGLRNFLRNLRSPMTIANQVLQGDVEGASGAFIRAAVNTVFGFGGVFDIADKAGLPYEQEDFGQTLAVWGVGNGPYVVVPLLGPSSVRDYAGYFVDSYADPLRWYLYNTDREGVYYAKLGVEYLDLRESLMDVLEDLEKSSIDYYAAVRSTYYQRREALIRDEAATAAEALPDFDEYQ